MKEPMTETRDIGHKKFKNSETGMIPEDWTVAKLGDENCFELIMGQSPSSETYNENGIGLPFLQGNAEFGAIFPSPTIYCSKPMKIAKAGDVLMSVRAPVGEVNVAEVTCCIGRGVGAIRTKKGVDTRFLFYFLKSMNAKLDFISGGSTFKAITKTQLEVFEISLPPLSEQQKIAEILSTVDTAIQKVDRAIERTGRLKRGLMQRLLTRGIGHEKFKQTEIGRVPEEWNVVFLKEVTLPTESKDPAKEGIAQFNYVDISSINNASNKITGWNLVDSKNAPSRARQTIKTGDVIFATTRPYLKNIAIVPSELDGQICSTGFCVIRANVDTIPKWLFYNVLTERFTSKISSKMKGATYPAVSDQDVFSEKIPLPSISEQKKIAEILSAVDTKLELERRRREKLERVKKGLMADLLTGRKRVGG